MVKNMPKDKLFPALRSRMGDWIYYITFMSFGDIKEWIRPTEEIHKSKLLSDWIQRRLNEYHAKAIAKYLQTQPERMFNALFVGVYGGEPQWGEIEISIPIGIIPFSVTEDEIDEISRSMGVLYLTGNEKLFAIDGQHRVAGIKTAVAEDQALETEEVTVILVGHQTDEKGRERTRRLFTTLNKTAKRVAQTDIIALDEDNGAAIVARRMIDEFLPFRQRQPIAFTPKANIPESDPHSVTSVVTLFNLVQVLSPCIKGVTKRAFIASRPDDDLLNEVYEFCCEYWNALIKYIPEYNEVFETKAKSASDFRRPERNHLLFRPVGQRAFAEAVVHLIRAYKSTMIDAVSKLSYGTLWLQDPTWHHILWNPIQQTMMPGAKNRVMAKIHLLKMVKKDRQLPTKQNVDYEKMLRLRDSIENQAEQ